MTSPELVSLFSAINNSLFIIALLLSIFVLIYSIFKNCLDKIRNAALLKIKSNVHGLAGSKEPETCAAVRIDTAEKFLDITMNRETVLFNEDERGYIKKCFAAKNNLEHLRYVAGSARNKWRRIEAILSLGYAEDPVSLPILEKAIFDNDSDVSYFAMSSLAGIKNRDSARILLAFLKVKRSAAQTILSLLERFGPEISQDVIDMASSDDPGLRYWAIKLISIKRIKEASPVVSKLLSDPSADVRSAACDCIGRLGDTSVKDRLIERLGDEAWFVRMNAVRSLSTLFGKDVLDRIMPLVEDPSFLVKESVKSAVSKDIGAAIPYIGKILEEGDVTSRQEMVEAIEASGYLKKILDDLAEGDGRVYDSAFELLEKILGASVRFGIGSAAERYDKSARLKILAAIKKINSALAERIEKNWMERGIING